jgi:hypothetical protein
VRERVLAAGIEVEERASGCFLVRDPWSIAVLVVTLEGARASEERKSL